MNRGVVARTTFQSEALTPLVLRSDGRMVPAEPSQTPDAYPTGTPGFSAPSDFPGQMSEPSWMTRESLISGWKNSTVILGAGAVVLVAFLVMKPKQVMM